MNNQFLISLTEKYGAPLYVYNAAIIQRQYQRMILAFSSVKNVKLNYAVKSNTNINILKYLNNLGAGGDCVSVQEVKLCLAAGMDAQEISYTPNGVSFDEISEVHQLGVKITLDNLSSLDQFGKTFPQAPVSLRINPHIMAGGNAKISVGHVDSKFGISHTQIEAIKEIVHQNQTPINGVHMHTGSDIKDPNAFVEAMEVLLGIAEQFDTIEFIDLGSGFKVPYQDGDIETNLEELGSILGARFNEFCAAYGKDLKLVFEPGKFLVSEAGKFLTRVNVIKQTPNINFVGVDSGLNHLMRPMMYDAYHRVSNISNPEGPKKEYNVVGYICETDTFASSRILGEVREGDIICMDNAGAYCFSMSSNYNSRFRPAEVLVIDGKDYLIRQRETFEDLLKNQIEIDL
ncbi:diaminopimelate decarboxylase [Ochrovirga pacifica]|uniref:diaminopimelate decarboxylase n=1 Tax=Ochrovirga pacifica TaxID=1042376 RepID=UPI0002559AD4|nr:diaminopimelate decarboxylase [Ochrovirga pacifica]